ncbi:hypothetical protein F2Q70_00022370 [Brassica cretica]|uniref:Transposase MuDR plant domain-containing protein n=1 Tax=Brassica cretica TaxID=69181 RepID=A0A8S9GJF8_BRACR|nr:hypothetical protein F2Q70_00022370 [Brassica cretica]KAF2556934.1 hypothetical protein F2Q68_00016453 [Brassica cretica]
MNTESVELAYSLPEAMMQRVAPDTPPIYQDENGSREGEEADEGDEADEGGEDDDDMGEVENHDGEEDDGEEDDAEEDADIPDVDEAVDDAEDYNEYGKVKHKDEEEDDDMCFEDFKGTYGSEGGRSNANKIYVNQSFASRDALNIQVNKNSPCGTCHVNGCGWKIRASVKHGTNTFWVTKYVETHVGTEIRTVYFRLNKES